MTANQINYQKHLEGIRHNLVTEKEEHRANVASETENRRSHLAQEGENVRSHKASEAIGWGNVSVGQGQVYNTSVYNAEAARHNRKSEQMTQQDANSRSWGTVWQGLKTVADIIF